MTWKPELDELARREAFARQMGGADKVKRQRDQGRLTVRERIDGLLDRDSFHEVGAVSGTAEYDEKGELKNVTPANCVFGRGKVDGRTVVVVGDDFTVRGGSADASIKGKYFMPEKMAGEYRLPLIRMTFWLEVARVNGRVSLPVNTSLNGTMPAFTNVRVGSFSGMRLALGQTSCPCFLKNSRSSARLTMFMRPFGFTALETIS